MDIPNKSSLISMNSEWTQRNGLVRVKGSSGKIIGLWFGKRIEKGFNNILEPDYFSQNHQAEPEDF